MATAVQGAAAAAGTGGLALTIGYSVTLLTGEDEVKEEESQLEELGNDLKNILNEPREGIVTWKSSDIFSTTENSNYNDKLITQIAKHNRVFLVKANEAKNKEWWKWSFENKYLTNTVNKKDSLFENIVPEAEATTNKKTLEAACDEAYKKDKVDFDKGGSFLTENIGLFCTKGPAPKDLSEPVSVTYEAETSDISGYTTGILKVMTNRAFLVKADLASNPNEKWWKWAYKNKFQKVSQDTRILHTVFTGVNKDYLAHNASAGQHKALNKACDEAYKKPHSDFTSDEKLLINISAFCTHTKKSQKLIQPTA